MCLLPLIWIISFILTQNYHHFRLYSILEKTNNFHVKKNIFNVHSTKGRGSFCGKSHQQIINICLSKRHNSSFSHYCKYSFQLNSKKKIILFIKMINVTREKIKFYEKNAIQLVRDSLHESRMIIFLYEKKYPNTSFLLFSIEASRKFK